MDTKFEIDSAVYSDLNLLHSWHPEPLRRAGERFEPLVIERAQGSHLYLQDGRELIDATASWWCKSLGHGHQRIKQALIEQANKLEHVIFANTTNTTIQALSQKLSSLTHSLNKVFYAGDGASAVEIAMKMSLFCRQLRNEKNRHVFVALQNDYHGDTIGAMSVSDVGLFSSPYRTLLFDTPFIGPLPYLQGQFDPLWRDCEEHWQKIKRVLDPLANKITAVIIEPVVQGACGMKIYSPDLLRRLRTWTNKHGIHLIADEIMTGLGRTGKMFACEHANIEPDFMCLSKGLTSGWLAFSAVLTTNSIYQLLNEQKERKNTFLHSHTYSGNPLAASIALTVLNILEEQKICDYVFKLGHRMHQGMLQIAEQTGCLTNVRAIGAIAAADILNHANNPYLAHDLFKKGVEYGVLLRPIGNVLYWLPPLNMSISVLEKMREATCQALLAVI